MITRITNAGRNNGRKDRFDEENAPPDPNQMTLFDPESTSDN